MSDILDDKTALPRVTISFALGAIVLVFAASSFYSEMNDVSARQRTYIERRNAQHEQMQKQLQDLHARYDELCHELASRMGEVICE